MFTVIGEALLDMVQTERSGPFAARPGGGPMNIAVGLHRLGHPTQLMARLSRSGLGRMIRDHLEQSGIGLDASVSTDEQATLAFATLDDDGKASYDFYVNGTADWGWTAEELQRLPAGTEVLHTGSLAAALRPAADTLLELVLRLHAAGTALTSYDPNVRPALVPNRAGAVARVESFVAASHVVKASDDDLEWLYPARSPRESLEAWSALGPVVTVMTRGARGCIGLVAGGSMVEVAGRSVPVADTIGAGDSFQAALLSGLADAGAARPAAIDAVDSGALRDVLERAVRAAELTCQRAGADPPTRAELDAAT